MGSLSIWHWLIVLAVIVLVFGTKKLRNVGGDLGSAIKNFKASMRDGEAEAEGGRKAEEAAKSSGSEPPKS